MLQTLASDDWRSIEQTPARPKRLFSALNALAFNLCLLLLPFAGASALVVIARDQLYNYDYSEQHARPVAAQVARLNGELIQLDFDRQNQWDALVAMELQAGDLDAARGFLLSGGGMLSARSANVLNRATDATDRELEVAALQFLNPGTRERYAQLAERERVTPRNEAPLGSEEDFALLARAMLEAPETGALQFVLTGYALGLAGDLSPRMNKGAAALLDASRRDDYPEDFGAEVDRSLARSFSLDAFRQRSLASADRNGAIDFRAAFQSAVSNGEAATVRALLDDIGIMSEATSRQSAAALLTHARSQRDIQRLRLIAQAAGDRAAAAAKRLPRDGRLLNAARGQLTMNRDLVVALTIAGLASLGLVLLVIGKLVHTALTALRHMRHEEEHDDMHYASELIELSGSRSTWRPL